MGKNGNRMGIEWGGYEWELQRIMDIDFHAIRGCLQPDESNPNIDFMICYGVL